MAEIASRRSWVRRPSLTTHRLLAFGLALLCAFAGWVLLLCTGSVFWLLGLSLLSIWVGLKFAPFAVRTLERVGGFGRVKQDGDRLRAGRGTREVRLDEPFRLAIQFDQTLVRHTFRLGDVGVTHSSAVRTEKKAVSVLLATIEQADRPFQLVADDAQPPPFRPFDLQGLSYHRTPVAKPAGTVVRMHPDDLIDLLRVAHGAGGASVVAPPDAPETPGDPRTLFWPKWKSLSGAIVMLGLAIGLAAWTLAHAPARESYGIEEILAREQEQSESELARAEAFLGKRVVVSARDGTRLYGVVVDTMTRASVIDSRTVWRASLKVVVDALHDVRDRPFADGVEVPFGEGGEPARVGSAIEVLLDLAQEVASDAAEATGPAEAPADDR